MAETIIRTKSLCKNYGSFRAVKDLSIEVMAGEIVAVTGENGAGKTTLIKMLSGILSPTSGEISISGCIGYMSQTSALLANMTAKENYWFYGVINNFSRKEIEFKFGRASEMFGMDKFASKKVEELTSGWKQLLSFSIATMKEPRVLLLDEPTAGVDTITRGRLWDCVRDLANAGTSVVVTSHYSSEAAMSSRNIQIHRPEQ